MTGWGQDGPLAQAAGHDMNYIAITGALFGMGQDKSRPHFPANLVGDFGGGSTYLVIGVLAALLEARVSGEGQVVDAAIVDGTAHLNAMSAGVPRRPAPAARSGPPTCSTAACRSTTSTRPPTAGTCRSGRWSRSSTTCSSTLLGIADAAPDRYDLEQRRGAARPSSPSRSPRRTQAEWSEVFEGTDACVAPILPLSEATEHPHIAARGMFVEHDGLVQPAPAPRFSRTPASLACPRRRAGRRHPRRPGRLGHRPRAAARHRRRGPGVTPTAAARGRTFGTMPGPTTGDAAARAATSPRDGASDRGQSGAVSTGGRCQSKGSREPPSATTSASTYSCTPRASRPTPVS